MCLADRGISNVKAHQPFRILVANFGDHRVDLLPQQVIETELMRPDKLFESHMSHIEMLALVPEDRDTNLRERHVNVCQPMGVDEKPVTAIDIDIDVPQEKKPSFSDMLLKFEHIWSDQLGDINNTEMRINLVPHAEPLKAPPHRAGPKTRELEVAEIDNQLKAGIIEPAMSEWAAAVLFVPKKDEKRRFCIDYRKLNTMTVK